MWRAYGEEVQFFVVYIREAHALDGYLPKGGGEDPILEDPTTVDERHEVASTCMTKLALEPLPALVDTIDDAASRAYDAWPDRLFLVGRDGRVAFQGDRGPDGFRPDELERAIRIELGLPVLDVDPSDSSVVALRDDVGQPRPQVQDRPREVLGAWNRELGYERNAEGRWVREPVDFTRSERRGGVELFESGDDWLPEALANDYHSRLLRWWRLPSEHFVTYATTDLRTTRFALQWMESTWDDLVRVYGFEPDLPATVILTRSLEQYNLFGITQPDGLEDVPPELTGRQALYHAFPCESWVDVRHGRDIPGAAATYWDDRTEVGNRWGPLAVRHAAGLAFAEALDPSPEEGRRLRRDPEHEFDGEAFWSEKQVPPWLRYGAATYVERYFIDRNAADPRWARDWSFEELEASGGIGDLDALFAFDLDQNEVGRSRWLILRAGAVVAFVLDGAEPAVLDAHRRVQDALRSGIGVEPAWRALEDALKSAEPRLQAFVSPG